MSKKNNVISAIKSSWKDLQKSLTEFSYDKLAQQDSSFSNQVLNTLYEIRVGKECSTKYISEQYLIVICHSLLTHHA